MQQNNFKLISIQVKWVDFGYTEMVQFKKLSTHIDFVDIPIQVIKCHLSNVNLISDDKTENAKELCNRFIYNQLCIICIHDKVDMEQSESLACNIQSLNIPLDLSSVLISQELVQYKAHSYRKFDKVIEYKKVDFKRTRSESDVSVIKDSSELHTYQDFKDFFRSHMAINPMYDENNSHENDNDDDGDDDESRIFEIFEPQSKRWGEKVHKRPTNNFSVAATHPTVDRITEHFKLMNINKSAFMCRCVYIMDPVTLLIKLPDMKPLKIDRFDEQLKYFPLEGMKNY